MTLIEKIKERIYKSSSNEEIDFLREVLEELEGGSFYDEEEY